MKPKDKLKRTSEFTWQLFCRANKIDQSPVYMAAKKRAFKKKSQKVGLAIHTALSQAGPALEHSHKIHHSSLPSKTRAELFSQFRKDLDVEKSELRFEQAKMDYRKSW